MEAATSSSPDDFKCINHEEVSEELHQRHNNQLSRIQELKSELQSVKLRLEDKTKENADQKLETFRSLKKKYDMLRDEYTTLAAKGK